MVLYTRVSDITLWGYYQPLTISIRTTMTTMTTLISDVIPEVSAFVEAIGYVVISVVMAVIVLKNTD